MMHPGQSSYSRPFSRLKVQVRTDKSSSSYLFAVMFLLQQDSEEWVIGNERMISFTVASPPDRYYNVALNIPFGGQPDVPIESKSLHRISVMQDAAVHGICPGVRNETPNKHVR
ncbi:Uncharacterised protein [uncultured archaeon]|nr:Uncharacterised protein [uncultured archaeon]